MSLNIPNTVCKTKRISCKTEVNMHSSFFKCILKKKYILTSVYVIVFFTSMLEKNYNSVTEYFNLCIVQVLLSLLNEKRVYSFVKYLNYVTRILVTKCFIKKIAMVHNKNNTNK